MLNWFLSRFNLPIVAAVIIIFIACREEDANESNPPPADNQFSNPLLTSAPDPWVEQHGDWYYFTHTTGNSIRLYRTKDMSELSNAEAKTVWSPPASGMNSKNLWAPEIQYINGKWYFYYAADNGENENHRMWALVNTSADPFSGSWTDAGKVALPEDKWAIDGSSFEHNGELFFVWSGWEANINVQQEIYIAKMKDPLTAMGDRIMLSKPTLDWEKVGGTPAINEAPQFLTRDNKVFIVYSASGCWTDDYTLGILTANADADLLNPMSWSKSASPVFVKNPDGQAFGPGHNSFFKSPDGTEDWIIYHANPTPGQGCGNNRSTRMQMFTWNEDGTPNFGVPAPLGAKLDEPSGDN
jgi:GH43 family beta-xylosidase